MTQFAASRGGFMYALNGCNSNSPQVAPPSSTQSSGSSAQKSIAMAGETLKAAGQQQNQNISATKGPQDSSAEKVCDVVGNTPIGIAGMDSAHKEILNLAHRVRHQAMILIESRNYEQALQRLDFAIGVYQRAYGGACNEDEALCLELKSKFLPNLNNQRDEALQCADKALEIERQLAGPQQVTKGVAQAHCARGKALISLLRHQDAVEEFRQAVAIGQDAGAEQASLENYVVNLGSALVGCQQYLQSIKLLDGVIERLGATNELSAQRTAASADSMLGAAWLGVGQPAKAVAIYERAFQRFASMGVSAQDPDYKFCERLYQRAKEEAAASAVIKPTESAPARQAAASANSAPKQATTNRSTRTTAGTVQPGHTGRQSRAQASIGRQGGGSPQNVKV
jgi:tetratricopeptide (TPR) repeat protein